MSGSTSSYRYGFGATRLRDCSISSKKPCAEARLLFFVGLKSVENVGFCFRRDDERSAHSAKIRRLTSAQGEPALGLAR